VGGSRKDGKKDFRHDPFKPLKGFRVSTGNEAPPPAAPRPEEGEARPAQDEAGYFAEEMARLGVDRRAGGEGVEKPRPEPPAGETPAPEVPPPDDEALFLASLGTLQTVFADELPEPEAPPPSPRRMRQLRRGGLLPEAQLDLHGLDREAARERVRHFLDDSVHHGMKAVLIVTGRGKGSGGEPVLRNEIERYLRDAASVWVLEWGRAPARFGGEGALVVFLKGRKGK